MTQSDLNDMHFEIEKIYQHFQWEFDTPEKIAEMNAKIKETKQIFLRKDKLKDILND